MSKRKTPVSDDTQSFVYGLADPRNNQIRYIGWTVDLEKRYKGHLTDNTNTHKVYWIQSLLRDGIEPEMYIIEEIPVSLREEREKYWIEKYGRKNLVNGTDGGDGTTGYVFTDEQRKVQQQHAIKQFSDPVQRARLASLRLGTTMSNETRRKIGAAHVGRKRPPRRKETIEKHRLALVGKKHTPEHNKKISEALKESIARRGGFSAEHRKNLGWARGRHLSDEQKKKISEGQKLSWEKRRAKAGMEPNEK